MAKHFLKTLTIFVFMIVLGLIGVFVVEYLDNPNIANTSLSPVTEVAN
jgi:hypothetical protein